MDKAKNLNPVMKWAGGKRQLLTDIEKYIPASFDTYYEPFLGGAAVLLDLKPDKAVVNDINSELMNLYRVIRDDADELIEDLKKHKNEKEYYYAIRALDRDEEIYSNLSDIEKASRTHFLNKTCFNGLYRVNKKGQFNTPFGKYKNPNIVNEENIRTLSLYFNDADIILRNTDFEDSLRDVDTGDFVYLDPPYDPISESSSFTSYASGGFDKKDQERLKRVCDKLDAKGVKFLLSNSDTEFINELYSDYRIEKVKAKRFVNANAKGRGPISEVLVRNYD